MNHLIRHLGYFLFRITSDNHNWVTNPSLMHGNVLSQFEMRRPQGDLVPLAKYPDTTVDHDEGQQTLEFEESDFSMFDAVRNTNTIIVV